MTQYAAVHAVLTTLVRATVDARVPIVLRTRRAEQAHELARWLADVHGSERIVIPSARRAGLIEVRLPRHLVWPEPTPVSARG